MKNIKYTQTYIPVVKCQNVPDNLIHIENIMSFNESLELEI